MGRRQGDTDLRTLQKHVAETLIQLERRKWLRKTFKHRRRWTPWGHRSMTLLGFQVMVNEALRECRIRGVRYRGR